MATKKKTESRTQELDQRLLKKETRSLPCTLTPEELADMADDLATTCQAISSEESRQKSIKDQMKATISELESRRAKLAITVSRREEFRDVAVEHWTDESVVEEIRQDTGECIKTRPIANWEKQGKLDDIPIETDYQEESEGE